MNDFIPGLTISCIVLGIATLLQLAPLPYFFRSCPSLVIQSGSVVFHLLRKPRRVSEALQ
ncbi:hypothetical protein L211DRAFT_834320 [Terfezia boudieri ATCC MYA-4762]|uniref:Uncharacterized protein n=1 Tax=Terfezia boudieri ATCC MYA-4762 TaxID=1051890 RepID=A0A3N4M0T5_9PEZI|nr:hypothetical protein L211DRAFT_834320 [Terfezia boudieri ATCC MYA-4762]